MRFRIGEVEVDALRREVRRKGISVPVEPKVVRFIVFLLERRHRAVSKAELLAHVWPDTATTEGSLTRVASLARRSLQASGDFTFPIIEPVRGFGYRIAASVLVDVDVTTPQERLPSRSLAVVPFRSESESEIGLEMASALITRLAGLPGLTVRPFEAVESYSDVSIDALAIGREQSVEAVVDGELSRREDRYAVRVALVRVRDGVTLDKVMIDIGCHEAERATRAMAERVARAMGLEDAPIEGSDEVHARAHRDFVRGRISLIRRTVEGNRRAIQCFERVLETDPSFWRAHAGLADAYVDLGTAGVQAADSFARARREAKAALAIEPRAAAAWNALGRISWQFDWRWDEAERCFDRARSYAPDDAEVWAGIAGYQTFVVLAEEAVWSAERARSLNPGSILIAMLHVQALYFLGRYEKAIEACNGVLGASPSDAYAHFFLGLSSLALDRADEAIEALEDAWRSSDRSDHGAMLAYAYARTGQRGRARALFEELSALASRGQASMLSIVLAELTLGSKEKALDALERAFDGRSWHVLLLASEPSLAPLRRRPRGKALLSRLGLRGRGDDTDRT